MTDMVEAGEFNPAPDASAPALRSFAALGHTAATIAVLVDEPVELVEGWFAGDPVPRWQAIVLELLMLGYGKSFLAELRERDPARERPGFGAVMLAHMQLATACLADQHDENKAATGEDFAAAGQFMNAHYLEATGGRERWARALAMIEARGEERH